MEPPEDRCGFVCTLPEVFRGRDDMEVEEVDDRWGIKKEDKAMGLLIDEDEWCPCSCCREVWQNGRCIWHADVENKPVEELEKSRGGHPERLDGAILRNVEFEDGFSFAGCRLRGAVFGDVRLLGADFSDANLIGAEFPDANLIGAEFPDANLIGAEFPDAYLRSAEFPDADLPWAEFSDAHLSWAKFPDAHLRRAEFPDAYLRRAKFPDANLELAEFPDTDLHGAEFPRACLHETVFSESNLQCASFTRAGAWDTDFTDTDLQNTEFHSSTLHRANFEDADLRDADFSPEDRPTNLENAIFEGANLRGADFTDARLFQADFKDVRLNSRTAFDSTRDEFAATTAYERQPDIDGWFRKEATPEEAAAWVHRRRESLYEENAMSQAARQAHVAKQEAERKHHARRAKESVELSREYFESDTYRETLAHTARAGILGLMGTLTGHGESLKRVLAWSAGIILTSGLLYPFVGGVKSDSNPDASYQLTGPDWQAVYTLGDVVHMFVESVPTLLQTLYFSVITFSTIGYGDLYPAGPWSKFLVGLESLLGAILVALFIFVIGRRVAR